MLRITTRYVISVALVFAAGCASVDGFQKPISDFSKSVQNGNTAISEAYLQRNPLEREVYLIKVLTGEETQLVDIDKNGNPTPVGKDIWSSESIAARLNALQMLSAYAERLAALAGADAPQRARTAITSAGASIGNIDETLVQLRRLRATKDLEEVKKRNESLSKIAGTILTTEQANLVTKFLALDQAKSEAALKDITAHEYIVPIFKAVGLLCEAYLEKKIEGELVHAIVEAHGTVEGGPGPVTEILDLLDRDLKDSGERTVTALNSARRSLATHYDQNKGEMSFNDRAALLKRFQELDDRATVARSATPSEIISRIKQAHDALYNYASSARKKPNLEELIVRLDGLSKDIEVLAEAVLAVSSK